MRYSGFHTLVHFITISHGEVLKSIMYAYVSGWKASRRWLQMND